MIPLVFPTSHSCTLNRPLQVMEKGYKRLTPDQPVGLRHAGYVISVQRVIKVRQNVLYTELGCRDIIPNKHFFSSLLIFFLTPCFSLCPRTPVVRWLNWRSRLPPQSRLRSPRPLSIGSASPWSVKCASMRDCKFCFSLWCLFVCIWCPVRVHALENVWLLFPWLQILTQKPRGLFWGAKWIP